MKDLKIMYIITVFGAVVLLINFTQAVTIYISWKSYSYSESNHKTVFVINDNNPSPNIYWLFMVGMLGFRAMEHIFDDPQVVFEEQLINRGFVVNRGAEFAARNGTMYAIPALMSPYYYDKVMLPLLESIDPSDYLRISSDFNQINVNSLFMARINNEFKAAFKAKGYHTKFIGELGYYWHPTTTSTYFSNSRLSYNKIYRLLKSTIK